jgi:hypothetical protein
VCARFAAGNKEKRSNAFAVKKQSAKIMNDKPIAHVTGFVLKK